MEENKSLPQFSDTKDSIVNEKYLPVMYQGSLELKNTLPNLNFGLFSLLEILHESLKFQHESLKMDHTHYKKSDDYNKKIIKDLEKKKSLKGRIDESRENVPEGEGELNLFKDFGKFLKKEINEEFDDFFTLGGAGGFNFGKYIKKGFGSLLGMTKPSEEKNKEKLFSQKNKIEDEIENLRKKESESSGSKKIEIGEKRRKLENELLEGPIKELQIIKQKELNEEINSLEQLKVRRVQEGASSKEVEDIEKEILETKQEFFELSEHMVSEYGKSFEKMDPLKESKVSEESKSSPSDFSFRPISSENMEVIKSSKVSEDSEGSKKPPSDFSFRPISPENMEVIDFDPTFGKVLGSIDSTLKSIKDIQENIEDGTEDLNKAIVQKPDNSADLSRQRLKAETQDDGGLKSTLEMNLKNLFKNLTEIFGKKAKEKSEGFLSSIGTALALMAAPIYLIGGFFTGLMNFLKMVIPKGTYRKILKRLAKVRKFFRNILTPLGNFFSGSWIGKAFKALKNLPSMSILFTKFKFITKFFTMAGRILGFLALPIKIITGLFGAISGTIEGYKKGGVIGAIKGALVGVFDALLGGFLDLIKDGISWVLNKLGFEDASKFLDSFSFKGLFEDFVNLMFDIPGKLYDMLLSALSNLPFVGSYFTKEKKSPESTESGNSTDNSFNQSIESGLLEDNLFSSDSLDLNKVDKASDEQIKSILSKGDLSKEDRDMLEQQLKVREKRREKGRERKLQSAIDSGLLQKSSSGEISIEATMLKESSTDMLKEILVQNGESLTEENKKLIEKEIESRKSENEKIRSAVVKETQTNTIEQSLVGTTPEQPISKQDMVSSSIVSNNLNSFMGEVTEKTHHIGYIPEGSSIPMNIPKITGNPDEDYNIIKSKSINMMNPETPSLAPRTNEIISRESLSESLFQKSNNIEMLKPPTQSSPQNPVNNIVTPVVNNNISNRKNTSNMINQGSSDSVAESFRKNY